jgi:RNA polymerase sigma-70 factor (ECF subfamily)
MGLAEGAGPDRADRPSRATLADILFAKPKPFADESEWVALVSSIAAHDKRALHALYQRTHRIVFTLILRITRNTQTAEELTVDVFHDVWRRASTYDAANGSVVGWVMNQARSRAIDRLRFEQRKKRVDPGAHEASAEDGTTGPHEALEIEEQARLLRAALDMLTPEERKAIEMAFFSGLTHAETAARLDQPLGTVKTRIRSGLDKLRRALGEESEP